MRLNEGVSPTNYAKRKYNGAELPKDLVGACAHCGKVLTATGDDDYTILGDGTLLCDADYQAHYRVGGASVE